MILLNDIFTALGAGEFSNMGLARTGTGALDQSEWHKIINHINLGLVDLHRRFKLLERDVKLHAIPAVTEYSFQRQKVVPLARISSSLYLEQPSDWDGYLNLIQIIEILDEDMTTMRLNNRHLTPYLRLMAPDTLQILGLTAATTYTIIYQAFPSKIILDSDLNPKEYCIRLPETYLFLLLLFIAAQVYKPMGKNDSTTNADKSNDYLNRYEMECLRMKNQGLDVPDFDIEDPIERGGWV